MLPSAEVFLFILLAISLLLGANVTIWLCRTVAYLDERRGEKVIPRAIPVFQSFLDLVAAWRIAGGTGSIPAFLKWQAAAALATVVCVLVLAVLVALIEG